MSRSQEVQEYIIDIKLPIQMKIIKEMLEAVMDRCDISDGTMTICEEDSSWVRLQGTVEL